MVEFHLPETMEGWPWPRRINPHYNEVKAESAAWFRSFNAFSTKAQRAFDLCDFSLLASLAYPTLSKEHLRTSCDMMNLVFVFDEYTDIRGPDEVEQLANVVMDALRNPEKERPAGECVVGEVARQFWHLGVQTASKTSQTRFLEVFDRYTKAVVDQARDRSAARMRTIEEYFEIRRLTIGTDPSYVPIEFAMDLPAEVYHHPTITALSLDVTDIILIDNDLCSYNKEQAAGDDLHNIICIAMHELNLDLDGALAWVASVHRSRVAHFFELWEQLQSMSWGPETDADVAIYLDGLANWVRANDCWNFESGRYFGQEGVAIQRHRTVELMPKAAAS